MAPHVPPAPELPVSPWHPAVMPDSGAWALSLTRCAHACCLQGNEPSAAAGKDGSVKTCDCWLMRHWGAQQRGVEGGVRLWLSGWCKQTIPDAAFCKGVPSDPHAVPSVRCPQRLPQAPELPGLQGALRCPRGEGRGQARAAPPRRLRTPRLGRGRSRRSTPAFLGAVGMSPSLPLAASRAGGGPRWRLHEGRCVVFIPPFHQDGCLSLRPL